MNTLEIIRGDDVDIPVTFTDSAGVAVNLTGATVFFTVKKLADLAMVDLSDAKAVIKKNITSFTNPTGGQLLVSLSKTDTNIPAGSYVFDLQIKYPSSGTISSVKSGSLKVLQDITQRTT